MSRPALTDVARFPRPGTAIPGKIQFSPDLKRLTFLHSERGDLIRDLWSLELATGRRSILLCSSEGVTDDSVSREEALRRERQRLRETGVTHYRWAKDADVLMASLRGGVCVCRQGKWNRLAEGAIDPHLTRDGTRLGFVRNGQLFVTDLESGVERQLTSEEGVTNGLAEFVAQEEMRRPGGFWFSRDGKRVAFERVDERHVPIYPIVHQGKENLEIEEHRYPFAGKRNALVRLGIVSVEGGPIRWIELGEEQYLARVHWHPDGRLFVQAQDRDQRRLELRGYTPDGSYRTLLVEESPLWVNLHDHLRFFGDGSFLWSSERSGFRHLYRYDAWGKPLQTLTSGEWEVDSVVGATDREVFFTAGREGPLEKHLYRVPLCGGEPLRLTSEPGMHDAVVARDGSCFVDIHDSRTRPYSVTIRWPDRTFALAESAQIELELRHPEILSFRSRDGETLYAALYKPSKIPAPCIVNVYGGPHLQQVSDSWMLTVDLRAQYLADRGFLVVRIDNRGSARRGLAFEGAIADSTGRVEVQDQVDGVRHLASLGLIDSARVGVYGWSYGGYMSAMCLATAGEVFKVAVAGAPVTHWDGYDTHYTERYMRTPQSNPEGYRNASVMAHVEKIQGKLMLIHGMLDENVHFRHTARLVNALVKANKPHDLLLLPDERHMPRREEDRISMEARIVDYFENHL